MWQKPNEKHPSKTDTKPKSHSRHYPSKILSQLMNSDSQDDYLEQVHEIKHTQKNNINRKQLPPLLINLKDSIKENVHDHANKYNQEIRYQCFKLHEGKLLEVSSSCQYNSLNLEQASIIPQSTESQQFQKLIQQSSQYQKLLARISELQQKNKRLQQELHDVNQQLKNKELTTNNQIQMYAKKIKQYQTKLVQNKKQLLNKKQKKQSQFFKYLSKNNKQNHPLFTQNNINQQIIQNVYKSIKIYLVKRIQEFKNKISLQKMNQFVQDIIQQFMTEIININSITVNRVVSKNNKSYSPALIRHPIRIVPQEDITSLSKSCLYRQNNYNQFSQNPTKTPPKPAKKPTDQKQKPQQLKQLQKSLTKLRQMQRQYANKRQSHLNKDQPEPLDRSSFIAFDLSRSKSRRKKIFQ